MNRGSLCEVGPPVSGCGARRMSLATERRRPPPTAAHAAPLLHPPPAAQRLAAIPNTEVKHICADDSCQVTGRENR